MFGALALDRVAQRALQHGARDLALHEVVLGSVLDRPQAQGLVVVAGEHDHGHLRGLTGQAHDALGAVGVGQGQVEQHHVHVFASDPLQGRGQAAHRLDRKRRLPARVRQLRAHQIDVVGVVVDDQQLQHAFGHGTVLPPESYHGASRRGAS